MNIFDFKTKDVERGSGTVVSIIVIGVLIFVASVVICLFSSYEIRYRAQVSADMAALAAAQQIYGQDPAALKYETPCEGAKDLAKKNQTVVSSCVINWSKPATVEVIVEAKGWMGIAKGRAIAGPVIE